MNVLSYAKLMSEQNSLEAIREGARVICERRGRYADTISNDIERIKSEISVIESLIKTIEENSSVLDSNQESKLKSLCEQLKKSLKAYLQKAQSLCNRFNNKKIKVLAFGLKSEGKSTFTRRYTGLPESVVAVKGDGADQDKTGALSVIYHDNNYTKEDPKIIVHFKTQEEILAVVNFCVRKLGVLPNFKLPNCTDSGYSTWNDLATVLDDIETKNKAYQTLSSLTDGKKIVDFAALKSFLESVFEKESNFDDVRIDSHSRDIKISELPLYNDMTNVGERRYLSVDRIEIYANLGYEGIFENFEICDTKGISARAGGAMIVEQGLYNEINNSDAVFSIKRVGQGAQSDEFYSDLSNNIINCDEGVKPEGLDNKHFAIFNLLRLADKDTIKNTIKTINDLNLAKCIYIGSLGDNISYEGTIIDADMFARAVIVDMLSKIVDSTKESDDLLIKSCNELVKIINNNKKLLDEFLRELQNKEEECNIDNMLLRAIDTLRKAAIDELEKMARDNNITLPDVMVVDNNNAVTTSQSNIDDDDFDDESETDIISEETTAPMPLEHLVSNTPQVDPKLNIRIFRMITARPDIKDKDIEVMLKKCQAGTKVSDLAISYILENEIKPHAGSTVYMGPNKKDAIEVDGTASTLGGYIDSVSSLLYDKIATNINVVYARSQSIDSITGLNETVYRTIWEKFKLDKLFGKFNEQILIDNNHNDIVNMWHKLYSKPKTEPEGAAITPEKSYNILITYFRKVDYIPTSMIGQKTIVKWELLKQAILEVYRRYNFEERVLEKLANEEMMKRNIFVDLTVALGSDSFVSGIKGMYMRKPQDLLKAEIITSDEFEKISNQYKWGVLSNTREQLSSKNVTSLPNIE